MFVYVREKKKNIHNNNDNNNWCDCIGAAELYMHERKKREIERRWRHVAALHAIRRCIRENFCTHYRLRFMHCTLERSWNVLFGLFDFPAIFLDKKQALLDICRTEVTVSSVSFFAFFRQKGALLLDINIVTILRLRSNVAFYFPYIVMFFSFLFCKFKYNIQITYF